MPGARPRLTERERDVLIALCRPILADAHFTEPASIRRVADELVVTDAAVKQHLLHLYDKFGLHEGVESRRVRLANEALEGGWVSMADLGGPPGRPHATRGLERGREAAASGDWEAAVEELSPSSRPARSRPRTWSCSVTPRSGPSGRDSPSTLGCGPTSDTSRPATRQERRGWPRPSEDGVRADDTPHADARGGAR
jgi:hypothetical protein